MLDLDLESEIAESRSVEEEDADRVNEGRADWVKFKGFNKGKKLRGSFLTFDRIEVSAAIKAINAAKKEGKAKPSSKELQAIAMKALEERAAQLSKSVKDLTDVEKLDLMRLKFPERKGYYIEGVGAVCPIPGEERDPFWTSRKDSEKKNHPTIIVLYPVNDAGAVIPAALKDGCLIKRWKMQAKFYEEDLLPAASSLREQSDNPEKQVSAACRDFTLTVSNPEFEGVKIGFGGKALWTQHPAFQNMILEKAIKFYDQLGVYRAMSVEDLRKKLGDSSGGGGGSKATTEAAEENFADHLSGV